MTASLHIQTALRGRQTYLKNVFCTTPFKVANITEDKSSEKLELMLMSSSPGILDGDEYQIRIDVAEGCSLQLHTQSYQRLFTMKKGAVQNTGIHLADHAALCFIPHPAVPHKDAVFAASNKIYMSNHCRLIFGEILACGRKLNGEIFLFTSYHNLTEIYLNHKLVIKENVLIQPDVMQVHGIGQMEGYTHQASLIYLDESADIKTITTDISDMLQDEKDICFGISSTPVNGVIIRILGQKAEQLFDHLKQIADLLEQTYSSINRYAD